MELTKMISPIQFSLLFEILSAIASLESAPITTEPIGEITAIVEQVCGDRIKPANLDCAFEVIEGLETP